MEDEKLNKRYRVSRSVEKLPRIDQRVFWDSRQAYYNRDLENSRAPQYVDRDTVLMMPDQTLPYERASLVDQSEVEEEQYTYAGDRSYIYNKPYYSKYRPKIIPMNSFIKMAPTDTVPLEVKHKPRSNEKDEIIKALQKQANLLQLLNAQFENKQGFNRNILSNYSNGQTGNSPESKGPISGRPNSKQKDGNLLKQDDLEPYQTNLDSNQASNERRPSYRNAEHNDSLLPPIRNRSVDAARNSINHDQRNKVLILADLLNKSQRDNASRQRSRGKE